MHAELLHVRVCLQNDLTSVCAIVHAQGHAGIQSNHIINSTFCVYSALECLQGLTIF